MNRNNLYSRGMLFLDPPQGNNEGGGNGGQQLPPQNQQQGQPPAQQTQAPADPFAGIDLDMQPDHIRQAIESSRASLQQLQTQAVQGQKAQQTTQELQQQVETMRQQILQGQQNPQQHQQGQRNEPATMDEQLEQYYIAQGIPAEQAKKVTAMNKGAFEIFGNHFQKQIGQQMAPIANRVVEDSAQEAFAGAIQNDRVGWSQNEEIKQALWERTTAMAQQGQIVSPAVVANLAKIFYYDHLERGGTLTAPQNIVPINQPHTIPNMTPGFQQQQQQTRFSYPGAGNVPMTRHTQNNQQSVLDPETQAALAATTGNWAPQLQTALRLKQARG